MSKDSKIKKILNFVKGLDNPETYGRGFRIENGVLTLNSENENPTLDNEISTVFINDEIPLNEFASKIENPKFQLSETFMKRLDVDFTDHFKDKYITGLLDDTSTTLVQFTRIKSCRQTFASREEDVDMTPWKPEPE